ncbi:hypothetical protein ACFUJU_19565 [Streptomyces sp. NPDC057235]|uniref:hypothetical protein n=1 Tax=Streptomyces sp. NPDC057235 TaxID=3346058 RepID=UPI00363DA0FC
MNTFIRRTTAALSDAADGVTLVAGAATGAWVGYTYVPANLDTVLHLPFTGAAALAGAFAVNAAADLTLTPARRYAQGLPAYAYADEQGAVPGDLDEALGQVAVATEDDAARRAAQAAYRIDLSKGLLSNAERWCGYTTGEATFYLAPGAVLHYHREEDQYGVLQHHYLLLTAEDPTPVPITNVQQLHHELALRARETTEATVEAAPSTV